MKRTSFLLLCISACFSCLVTAQNFAPNPSFEIATGCVTGNGWGSVNSWYVPTNHGGSPDRFHTCAPGTFGVTANVFGDQAARTGNSYVGFVTHFGSNGVFREYLQAPLTSALIPGQSYTASAYISLSDGSGWATDGFGFLFSTTPVAGTGGSGPLPYSPQVSCATNNFMNNKLGWQLVTGNFVASSAFVYLTFGNYKTDAATNVQVQASGWAWNYTYLDDISVSPAVILSADMGDFTGEVLSSAAALHWDTKAELGTSQFIVERSIGDVGHFEAIGTVQATGSPTSNANYEFLDPGFAPTALNFYRIQEIDQNGAGGYSATIELHGDRLVNELSMVAYPNPVSAGEALRLDLNCTKAQTLLLEVMDMHGRLVEQHTIEALAGSNLESVNTSGLSPACYILRVSGNGLHATQRFLVAN